MMQHGIDIVEDIPLRHMSAVFRLELRQRPISNVLTAIAAILVVGVVGEALESICCSKQMQIRDNIGYESTKRWTETMITDDD